MHQPLSLHTFSVKVFDFDRTHQLLYRLFQTIFCLLQRKEITSLRPDISWRIMQQAVCSPPITNCQRRLGAT